MELKELKELKKIKKLKELKELRELRELKTSVLLLHDSFSEGKTRVKSVSEGKQG